MMPPNGARPKKQTPSVQLNKNVAHVLFAPQQDVEIARKTDEIEKLTWIWGRFPVQSMKFTVLT